MSQSILEKAHPDVRDLLRSMMVSPAWPYFEQVGQELINSVMADLSRLTDPVEIYRAQGKIEGIRLLLGFKDTLITKQPRPRY